ncbi:hypothetical protein GUJ93_ZPchr0002g24592 [Zizania palustris]|uniref:Uncharacterized protein n=1 Tax=Zizania palustris TaxID=103762 RepID=A0A8J5VWW4_ZIZPA|nr:hypothetical protein GUJ93_ZPchr0002g24592 [Zizania palustris]
MAPRRSPGDSGRAPRVCTLDLEQLVFNGSHGSPTDVEEAPTLAAERALKKQQLEEDFDLISTLGFPKPRKGYMGRELFELMSIELAGGVNGGPPNEGPSVRGLTKGIEVLQEIREEMELQKSIMGKRKKEVVRQGNLPHEVAKGAVANLGEGKEPWERSEWEEVEFQQDDTMDRKSGSFVQKFSKRNIEERGMEVAMRTMHEQWSEEELGRAEKEVAGKELIQWAEERHQSS